MGRAHVLDVSGLAPPVPMNEALAALRQLPRGDWLVLQHRHEPRPLYLMLQVLGFEHSVRTGGGTPVEVVIWHRGEARPGDVA